MKRPWVVLGILAVLILAAGLLSGPSAGDDAGPHGTLALRRYLGAMGLTVRTATRNALRWQVDSHVNPSSGPLKAASSVYAGRAPVTAVSGG